jgi:hypothetical protein
MPRRKKDWTSGITVEVMRQRLTPKQAAHVKYMELVIRSCTDQESLDYADRVIGNDPRHRWFCFCLDVVARTPDVNGDKVDNGLGLG